MIFEVNGSAIRKHAIRLQEISKSALPVVVRQTLNKAAFDVKTKTMPESSNVFIHRKPTFFKANSKVVQAEGFNIGSMFSKVGFIPKPDATDTSVSDLTQQERGGGISGRSFIPLPKDRAGDSWAGNVKPGGRIKKLIGKIRDSEDSAAKTDKGKFAATAKAIGVGGFFIGNVRTAKGNRTVWKVTRLGEKIGLSPLFAVKSGRKVNPPATHFMEKASLKTAMKMPAYFVELAEKKINSIK